MFLEKLSLRQFRNYNQADLDISSPITFFIGKNGSGKTSILEAIYCALRGQSFHSFVQTQFIKKGEKQSKISLFLREIEGQSQIQSFFSLKENNSLQKEHFYCGKKVRSSFFIKKYPCFVFTESSLKCIRQGPNERRDFIESLFYTKEHLRVKKEFYQVLKQKRQLLRNYKKGLLTEKNFLSLFHILNQTFLEKSKKIVQARLEILNEIFKFLPHISSSFFSAEPHLGFSYKIQDNSSKRSISFQSNFLEKQKKKEKEHQTEISKESLKAVNSRKQTEPLRRQDGIEQESSERAFLEESFIGQEIERQTLDFYKSLELDLKEKEQLEIQLGAPLSGPQKHELVFLFNEEDSRSFCSKGQQRAYILSLLLSHLKSIPKAFLFLDDVLLELDKSVQEKFLHLLEKNHCQIFLTNCNIVSFKVKRSSFVYIEKGQIKKLSESY